MTKRQFEKMVNDQLSICYNVYNSSDDYAMYTNSFELKKDVWIRFSYLMGTTWRITIYFERSYKQRDIYWVNAYIDDDGSFDIDIDDMYAMYKRMGR